MIRIVRSLEPSALTQRRQAHLPVAAVAVKRDLSGYAPDVVKQTLFDDQFRKCAWCESRVQFSSSPVEHVRPKNGAWRDVPDEPRLSRPRTSPTSHDHYWWLTWTWNNLVLSCVRCNDAGHKANYFPLAPGTLELQPPTSTGETLAATTFDTAAELPLLLDPTEPGFAFLDHVRWEPSQTNLVRRLWLWTPWPLSPRGDATIRILKLAEFADDVRDHLVRAVLPSIEEIEAHAVSDRGPEAHARWCALLGDTLAAAAPYTAATWCAIQRWVPAELRARWALPEPPHPPLIAAQSSSSS